jgi:hypothetical protein
MQTSYRLNVGELDEKFLRSVKELFTRPDEEIEITISAARDDTSYLLSSDSNREHLESALKDASTGRNLQEVSERELRALL